MLVDGDGLPPLAGQLDGPFALCRGVRPLTLRKANV